MDIRLASKASTFTVTCLKPTPGFTVRADFMAKQSSFTMCINQVSQSTSQLQCSYSFDGGRVTTFGSDVIQILLGSMKQDLFVILKCHCFCCLQLLLDCRCSHHILLLHLCISREPSLPPCSVRDLTRCHLLERERRCLIRNYSKAVQTVPVQAPSLTCRRTAMWAVNGQTQYCKWSARHYSVSENERQAQWPCPGLMYSTT